MSDLAMARPGRGSARAASRFTTPDRHRAFWVELWTAVAVAEFGTLASVLFRNVPFEPVDVVFRLVGRSFAACGLIAWHRLMFSPEEGNLLLVVSDARVAGIVDTVQRAVFVAVPVATAAMLATRWRKASTPGRRALLPGVAGAACLLLFALLLVVHLAAGRTFTAPAVDRGLLAHHRPRRVPTRVAALPTGARRARRAVPRAADGSSRRAAAGTGQGTGGPGAAHRVPLPDRTWVDGDGAPVMVPSRR
jgi:hypothetical protein